jgi:hypothetical protein
MRSPARHAAPAKTLHEMNRIVFNDYLDASLAGLFVAIVLIMVVYGIINARKATSSVRRWRACCGATSSTRG